MKAMLIIYIASLTYIGAELYRIAANLIGV